MSYSLTSAICIMALAIVYSIVYDNEIIDSTTKKNIYILSGIAMFEILINSISFKLNGLSSEIINLQKGLRLIEASILPVIPFSLAEITTKSKMQLKFKIVFFTVIFLNASLQILSFIVPELSLINEFGFQQNSLLVISYVGFTSFNYICLLYITSKTFLQKNRYNNSILFITIFLLIGLLFKLFLPNTNANWLVTTFCIYMFVCYIIMYFSKVDVLTSLLSQDVFLNSYKKVNYSTAIIMMDVNNFKHINDTYGHKSGDDCLKRIAEAIIKIYGKYGDCYRAGGDEFCIILKKKMLFLLMEKNSNHDCYASIEELMSLFEVEIKRLAEKDPLLIDGVSQGYGVFFLPEECRKESYQDIEAVLRYADKRMYEEKEKFKAQKNSRKGDGSLF